MIRNAHICCNICPCTCAAAKHVPLYFQEKNALWKYTPSWGEDTLVGICVGPYDGTSRSAAEVSELLTRGSLNISIRNMIWKAFSMCATRPTLLNALQYKILKHILVYSCKSIRLTGSASLEGLNRPGTLGPEKSATSTAL